MKTFRVKVFAFFSKRYAIFFISLIFSLPAYSHKLLSKNRIICSFSKLPISPTKLEGTPVASQKYRILVTSMFAYSGNRKYIFVGQTNPADSSYAYCGYNSDDLPEIVLNEARLDRLPISSVVSILAHELGHYGNHDIEESILTPQMELFADWHNGFWCSRNGFDDLKSIFFPYSMVGEDLIHPDYNKRTGQVKEGYDFGKTAFSMDSVNKLITLPLSVRFSKAVDLIVTVDPKFTIKDTTKYYNVFLNVATTGLSHFKDDTVLKHIEFVRYVIDTTFRRELIKNIEKKSNFEFKCTKVWGDFPVTAIIRFDDYTEISITKSFILP